MRLDIMNLKHLAGVGLCAAAVLFGGVGAYGQGRHAERKAEHRTLKTHQKFERRELKDRLQSERRLYGNTSDWRARRQAQRVALRQHQRAERLAFKQRYNPGRHLGRGYYRAPGQRTRYVRGRRYVTLRSRSR